MTPEGRARNTHRFRLTYRPPYDWKAALAFMAARATPGVESVQDGRYRRTVHAYGKSAFIDISHHASRPVLLLEVRGSDPRSLRSIVERVRRVFDLGAVPSVIEEHLRPYPLLAGPIARHPGIRTPGAWDGFELAVRAILGQQISVRAATTIAGRIASLYGSPIAGEDDLNRLFPTPEQLADADLECAGVMPARAATIRSLARHAACGAVGFGPKAECAATLAALEALPGIGAWTAGYIAMRAFGEPDAFLAGDLVLRRAAGNCTARELERRSQVWRPWRAYAVMLLWQDAVDNEQTAARRAAQLIKRAPYDQPARNSTVRTRTRRSLHLLTPDGTK